jgi:CheY-like chemotaxis protein
VLVIDDDPLFRSLLVAVLRHDHLVSVGVDGADGYRQAVEQPPDLVVIDIQMPGWNGLQTLTAIRGNPELSHVGAVILTSDASRETVLAAIRAGADEYVIKTHFSRDEFLQKLARLKVQIASRPRLAKQPPAPHTSASLETVSAAPAGRDGASAVAEAQFATQLQELIDAWD